MEPYTQVRHLGMSKLSSSNQMKKTYMNPQIGHKVTRIITPEVKKAAGEHFNCTGLDGGELEDGGNQGETAGSHWEKSMSSFLHLIFGRSI